MLKILDEIHTVIMLVLIIGIVLFGFVFSIGIIIKVLIPFLIWGLVLFIVGNKINQELAIGLGVLSILVFYIYLFMNPGDAISLNELYPSKEYPPSWR